MPKIPLYGNSIYHWGISKPFDGLEDPTTDGPHCEGPPTIVHYPPGTEQ